MVWKACVDGCHEVGERAKVDPGVDAECQKVTCRCVGSKGKEELKYRCT